MACLEAHGRMTELDFALALDRRSGIRDCLGPRIALPFTGRALGAIEDACDGSFVFDALWDNWTADRPGGMVFNLCAAHWFDLAGLIARQAARHRNREWFAECYRILDDTCRLARWDTKEIANLFTSRWSRGVRS